MFRRMVYLTRNVFDILGESLSEYNGSRNTCFEPVNQLVSDVEGKMYNFHLFNNAGSSSMFGTGKDWTFDGIKECRQVEVGPSTRLDTVIESRNWGNQKFDLIIDVQGAELKVLEGLGKYIANVVNIRTEISTKEIYDGGVQFEELDKFIMNHGFTLQNDKVP